MSRELGSTQRGILEVLQKSTTMLDSIALAAEIYHHRRVTKSEASIVRRALRSLEKLGQVTDMGRGGRNRRRMWTLPERAAAYQVHIQRKFGS